MVYLNTTLNTGHAHGLGKVPQRLTPALAEAEARSRLRILIPGRLAPHKGLYLFSEIIHELVQFAEVLLLGCGDFGRPFADVEHVEVIADYDNATLAAHVAAHSIVAVKGSGPVEGGNDGVVRYESAHLEDVPETIVRSSHSTQSHPETIAELIRILKLHASETELRSSPAPSPQR